MPNFDIQNGPSLSDLMNQKAMQQAQIGAMGQESQLRNLQMQTAQRGAQDQEQLRALLPQLMQSGDPQGMLKSLMMSGNPQAMEMAGKMAPILASLQKDDTITYEDFGGYKQGMNQRGVLVGERIEKTPAPKEFQPSDLSRLTAERAALPPGDPRIKLYDNALTKLTTHQPAAVQNNYAPGAMGLGKGAANKVDETLLDKGALSQRMYSISAAFKPEFLTLGTKLQSGLTGIKDKFGLPIDPNDKAQLIEFTKFKRNAIDNMNVGIKEATGATMGVEEAERLMKAMPNPGVGMFDGDGPTEFKAKMDDITQKVKLAEARLTYIKRNGLSLMDQAGKPIIALEKMPTLMNERGTKLEAEIKLKNPNIDPKMLKTYVRRQLASEFGLVE